MRPCIFDRQELFPGLWKTMYDYCGGAFWFGRIIPEGLFAGRIDEI